MTKATLIYQGKVRDIYDEGETLLLQATDRLSAFDRAIADIPNKARVLNLLSAWWFEKTRTIVANHMLECPTETSMRVKKCQVFPVEVVVRGFLTGSTATSIWPLYQQGQRQFFATTLEEGLQKNQALAAPILTPTSKETDHDRPLTLETIGDWIDPENWQKMAKKAQALFAFGQQMALKKGLILVDTKYEFGLDSQGNLLLVDECHTPDSSRYWLQESYQQRIEQNLEPENFDKEFMRLWYREHCDPYADAELPKPPRELVAEVERRYRDIYQRLTGSTLCAASSVS